MSYLLGLFGHSGDEEVWEGMDENRLTQIKMMLDDMHKTKIDMTDEIFVINPGGYIGENIWFEICYAYMTGKYIDSMEYINSAGIEPKSARSYYACRDVRCETI